MVALGGGAAVADGVGDAIARAVRAGLGVMDPAMPATLARVEAVEANRPTIGAPASATAGTSTAAVIANPTAYSANTCPRCCRAIAALRCFAARGTAWAHRKGGQAKRNVNGARRDSGVEGAYVPCFCSRANH